MSVRDLFIVHYHEVGLKGGNRSLFERALMRNIVSSLADVGEIKPKRLPGRILIPVPEGADVAVMSDRISEVYGIANFARARGGHMDFDTICAVALEVMKSQPYETFAVRARSAHSDFSMSSRQINEELGTWLLANAGGRVNLSAPDRTCHVEIVGGLVMVYADKLPGPGGLPVGTSGRVGVLLSAGIDSPVAAARLMQRGARATLIHFHSQPFTDGSSVRNTVEIAQTLTRRQHTTNLYLVALAPSQQQIVTSCPEGLRTLLYRRMMMRIASELARLDGAQALVTGDSLGQVASQTIENLTAVEAAATLPVLRPLIGMDKIEIIDDARALGTFEVSSAPCQEACVLFEPRKPVTKARLVDLERAERDLDLDQMTKDAVEAAELRTLTFPATDRG
jgi:tRNA uracil 4-sulfurtransferase